MSGFFSDLNSGVQKPDVVWNRGPLPPTTGLPSGFDGTPDARINYNSTLLGDISAYSYGKPARSGTQAAVLNIPHRVAKIVPQIRLPDPEGLDYITVPHAVADGDIVFTVRVDKKAAKEFLVNQVWTVPINPVLMCNL